jgi:hypothetical protein
MTEKKPSSGKQGPGTARDSGSGEFVTKDYAKKHPKTTEVEHNKKDK